MFTDNIVINPDGTIQTFPGSAQINGCQIHRTEGDNLDALLSILGVQLSSPLQPN